MVGVNEVKPVRGVGRTGARLRGVGLSTGCVLAALLACSPTLNWRDVRPAGSAVRATLPCKPDAAQRMVGLAGQSVELNMLSCDVGDLTFAMASLRAPPGVPTQTVVDAWQQASAASLKVPTGQVQPWVPELRLPPAAAMVVSGWQATGARPDGRAVKAHVFTLSRDGEVVQLAVYGPVAAAVLAQWLEGVTPDPRP